MAANYNYEQWILGDEVNLAQNAIAHLRRIFPEGSVSPASVEAALLETQAVVGGPVLTGYQTLPSRVIEHLMPLYGLERYPGFPAEGKVRVTVNPTASQVRVPKGTVLRHYLPSTSELREYRTIEDLLVLPAESVVGEVRVQATTVGPEHNGVVVGAQLDVDGAYFPNVDRFEISESPRGGEGPEPDTSWWARCNAQLQLQSSTLVTPDQVRAAALVRPEVHRATVLNLHDPANPTVEALGHVSVAVADNEGLPVTPLERTEIQDWLQDKVLGSLQVHVIDATYTTVNPTVVVEAAQGATLSLVETAVRAQLTQWINPATWDWWSEITGNDFVSAIDDVAGVARVITVPQLVTLNGFAPLPKLGTVTVKVNPSTRGGA